MKKVLFIAYDFPPLNSGGSHRPFRFAKGLSAHHIQTSVFTLNEDEYSASRIDPNMFSGNEDFPIFRSALKPESPFKHKLYSLYYFNIVDTFGKRWKKSLFEQIDAKIKEQSFDAILLTVPPFSLCKLASELKKKYQLPLIIDFRDAWSHWIVAPYATRLHYLLVKRLERKALKAADHIVTTSDQTCSDFQRLNPDISKSKFSIITNSYTKELTTIPEKITFSAQKEKITIGYVGSFYYTPYQRKIMFSKWWKKKPYQYFQYTPRKEDWLYRTPYFLFKVLAQLKEEIPNLHDLISVQFVGNTPDWLTSMIEETNVNDIVTLLGRKSHPEALQFQASCDALFITSSKVVGGDDYSIAGKTYEYISQLKPIIAFVSQGAQKRLLEKTGLSILFDPDDIQENVNKLKKVITEGIEIKPDKAFIQSVHTKSTTTQLAEIITTI